MQTFPIFVDVAGRRPLVVGGGRLAAAKVRTILTRAGHADIAAAVLVDELAEFVAAGAVRWLQRPVHADDITSRPFVVAATEDTNEDTRISDLAMELGVPVNVPDRPDLSTFAFGAMVTRGDVTVAIGTNGKAPVLATRLRAWLEEVLSLRLGRLAVIAAGYRDKVVATFASGPPRRQFWETFFDGPVAKAVLAGDEAGGRKLIEALLEGGATAPASGRIILVGAGPGDPELMTLAAVRALKAADVVLYDKLVGPGVLDCARREAELVAVGKRSGEASMSQSDINALMIDEARAGKCVVRLKGGDGLVFGRAAEELAAAERAGVPVEIVPGITAAQAAAAQVRLPLTTRGHVQQFSLVTARGAKGDARLDWAGLAQPGQAFAVYMGLRRAGRLARRLIGSGADPTTRVVVVESASRANARAVATNLRSLGAAVREAALAGPAVMLVGLDWSKAGLSPPHWIETYEPPAPLAAGTQTIGANVPTPAQADKQTVAA
jgi:uroporphyrin-III C-methyltransferase / precorrin-2 dehydrogenase / sirohydrochlorin ferrochelatase